MGGWGREGLSRLLDALGLNMPTGEVILEHAEETVLRVFAQVGATDKPQITSAIFLSEMKE